MKVLTLYYSETGQTEKIAKAIHTTINEKHDSTLSNLKEFEAEKVADFDLVFVGSPCHSSDLAKPVKEFLEKLKSKPGYKLAGFYTHASYPPEKEGYKEVFEKWVGKCALTFETVSSEKEISFLGSFRSMGAPSTPIEGFIKKHAIPSEEQFEGYLKIARLRPNAEDIENARKFALDILQKM